MTLFPCPPVANVAPVIRVRHDRQAALNDPGFEWSIYYATEGY